MFYWAEAAITCDLYRQITAFGHGEHKIASNQDEVRADALQVISLHTPYRHIHARTYIQYYTLPPPYQGNELHTCTVFWRVEAQLAGDVIFWLQFTKKGDQFNSYKAHMKRQSCLAQRSVGSFAARSSTPWRLLRRSAAGPRIRPDLLFHLSYSFLIDLIPHC